MLDGRLGGDVLDLEHVDEPVELLGRLLDRDVVAVERDRHPADVGLVGVADRERVDVEVAGAHEAATRGSGRPACRARSRSRTWRRCLAAAGQRPRRRRAWAGGRRGVGAARRQPAVRVSGRRSFVGPAPLLDQVGQALAGRHHREDVLLLGDLEPDERRAVDRLGGPDRVVDLVRRPGPERRDPERVGELGEVRARAGGPSGSCPRR